MLRNTRRLAFSSFLTLIVLNETAAYFDVNTNDHAPKEARSSRAFPTSCEEALEENNETEGIFLLNLPNYPDLFYVNCVKDPWNGAAWTLIQRRRYGLVDFYRGWTEYVMGFGDLNGEFFIGLQKLNAFTTVQKQELWIQLEDFEGRQVYAKYDDFRIGDDSTRYNLQNIGNFEGSAGDSLRNHTGAQFSTKDMINTKNKRNCAVEFKGAWWYQNCYYSNLNGQYYGNKVIPPFANGITWYGFRAFSYSLKYAHMAIRPRNDNDIL